MERYRDQFREVVFKKTRLFLLLLGFVVKVTKSVHAKRDCLDFLHEETV